MQKSLRQSGSSRADLCLKGPWIHPDPTELSLGLTRISGDKADPESIPSVDEVNANRGYEAPQCQE